MKIAVLGASGRTGRLIVAEAMQRGHDTLAVVRRPDAVVNGPKAIADGRDIAALANALRGRDAVAFAIGPVASTPDPSVMQDSLTATLAAMKAAGVRRIVLVSAEGPWRDSGDPLTRFIAKPLLNRILAASMRDLHETELLLRTSDTDWTAIRPAQLTNGASTRSRRRREKSLWFGMQTTRAATAKAVVDAIDEPAMIGASYSVAR